MPKPSSSPQANSRGRGRLDAGAAATESRARNKRGGGRTGSGKLRSQTFAEENRYRPQPFSLWGAFKPVIALGLLPVCWVLSAAFFRSFGTNTFQHEFWATDEFRLFAIGGLVWLVAFFALPRPVTLYVFGHELTHAIWVLIMGGRVTDFKVGRDGGHIMTTKTNFWIALAPYFFPVYSIGLIVSFGIMQAFWDLTGFRMVLYFLLGVTWFFHLTFTVWMMTKEQTDLTHNGVFFSLVVIYLMNLLVLATLLITLSKGATWYSFWLDLDHELRIVYRLLAG